MRCSSLLGIQLLMVTTVAAPLRADQFVFVDDTITWTKNSYDAPPQLGPTDWTSPVDYVNGHVYARYHALEKPSTKDVAVQLCMWQDSYHLESCSRCYNYTTEGVYYYDWGTPANWWKKNPLDYTREFQRVYFMHKDGSCSAKLLMTGACGAACYTGNDIDDHVPIRFHVKVIVVSSGGTLKPPADWDCPWSMCEGKPVLTLNATTLEFAMSEGGEAPAYDYVRVRNDGTGTLSGVTTAVEYHDGAGWLEVTPLADSGNSFGIRNTIVDPDLLIGTYEAAVTVDAENNTGDSQTYTVSLTVSATPVIGLHGGSGRHDLACPLIRRDGGRVYVLVPGEGDYRIGLVDGRGRAVAAALASDGRTVSLDLHGFPAGIYFATVRHLDKTVACRCFAVE